MECHNELVEALGNNALPYRTVARFSVWSSTLDNRTSSGAVVFLLLSQVTGRLRLESPKLSCVRRSRVA
ncbi:hypothetical protein TNCV_295291 [Trichonephila clavipes]|nr:hypothetical protein TNCV_295291 [Trichonephila clavipes]